MDKAKEEKQGQTHVGLFRTTCWDQFHLVKNLDVESRRPVVEALAVRYWRPVYCYLVSKGYGEEEALDLTQGFFQDIVVGRSLFEKADPSKGRFRTLLLTTLTRYVAGEHRRQYARKRNPPRELMHLDTADRCGLPALESAAPPDQVFTYAWAADLVQRAMAEVEAECKADGRSVHWQVFHDRVVRPILEDTETPDLRVVCRRYGIGDAKTASNMVITVKRRLRAAVHRLLAETLDGEAEVGDELNDLMAILSNYGAA